MSDNKTPLTEEEHEDLQRKAREIILKVKSMPPEKRKMLLETLIKANQENDTD